MAGSMNGGGGRSVDWGLLVLRVFSGLGIAFGHGLGKLPPSDRFIAGTAELGFPMPFVFAWVAALSEFLGGIFMALGIFTRPAAFMVLMTMLVAVFRRHIDDPFPQKEKALLYATIALALVIAGGGRLALDRLRGRRG
jgi:putative oxidoreductase